jgi:hypothetical protein
MDDPPTPSPSSARSTALTFLCAFTALCALWLGAMSIRLHHPGYGTQILIAAGIFSQAVVTLADLRLPRISALKHLSLLGCIGMLWLSASAILAIVNGGELEGYVVIIALTLIIQSVLTFFTFPVSRHPAPGRA